MFDGPARGVQICAGRSGARLVRAGPPDELGILTASDVRARPFTGSVRDHTVRGHSASQGQLAALRDGCETLKLISRGRGRGAVPMAVEVQAEQSPLIRLAFEFVIHRTDLPEIIRDIGREFPPDQTTLQGA